MLFFLKGFVGFLEECFRFFFKLVFRLLVYFFVFFLSFLKNFSVSQGFGV
jgi:hypothetical protein